MFELVMGIFVILVCIGLEGFFSGTETAMVSVDRARMKALAEQGSKRAVLVNATLEAPEKFFSTTFAWHKRFSSIGQSNCHSFGYSLSRGTLCIFDYSDHDSAYTDIWRDCSENRI